MNKVVILKRILIVVYLIEVFTLLGSLQIYTSLYKWVPWYELCGLQFMANFSIFSPILFFVGLILLLISKKLPIARVSLYLPWINLLVINYSTINTKISSLNVMIGTVLVTIAIFVTIFFSYKSLTQIY